jgi:hypothetical protein
MGPSTRPPSHDPCHLQPEIPRHPPFRTAGHQGPLEPPILQPRCTWRHAAPLPPAQTKPALQIRTPTPLGRPTPPKPPWKTHVVKPAIKTTPWKTHGVKPAIKTPPPLCPPAHLRKLVQCPQRLFRPTQQRHHPCRDLPDRSPWQQYRTLRATPKLSPRIPGTLHHRLSGQESWPMHPGMPYPPAPKGKIQLL